MIARTYSHDLLLNTHTHTHTRREAGELRQILEEGTAPKPPKFWSAKPDHPDVGDDGDALTHELLLCWRQQTGTAVRAREYTRGLLCTACV